MEASPHKGPRSRARARHFCVGSALVFGLLVATAGQASAQGRYPNDVHSYADCGTKDHPMGPTLTLRPGNADQTVAFGVAGDFSCSELGHHTCSGYLYHHPIAFDVVAPMTVDIEVSTTNVDTVLAVVGPYGVLSDDDGGWGTNSRITTRLGRGRYLLYGGTYRYGEVGYMSVELRDASPTRVHQPRRPGFHRPPDYWPGHVPDRPRGGTCGSTLEASTRRRGW